MNTESYNRWFLCVFVCLLVGVAGSIAHHATVGTWYVKLIKPIGTPPNWVFPIIWTFIYILMGTAWWYFWRAPATSNDKTVGWWAFFIQLFLNFLWPWIFFYQEHIGMGLLEIMFLWVAILVTVISFYRHSRIAGLLLLPYIAWVSYAVYLNYGIWFMNF